MSALTGSAASRASVPGADAVVRALTDPSRLVQGDWRSVLAPQLAAMPELRTTRSMGAQLGGQVRAGTLNLPKTVELTGDTTILADQVVFAGENPRIETHGHALHLLPIAGIRTASGGRAGVVTVDASGASGYAGAPAVDADPSAAGTDAVLFADVSQNASGQPGPNGLAGTPGTKGSAGAAGTSGQDILVGVPNDCFTYPFWIATSGRDGGTGGNGTKGGNGTRGGDGGPITVAIPAGSADRYQLISTGGRGGNGGNGGRGGDGGDGGNGGNGGTCLSIWGLVLYAGNGGSGGNGGTGGSGGDGGNGGNGGNGGRIVVTYPPGYDRSLITTDVSGGAGGFNAFGAAGGNPGSGGQPGFGGQGAGSGLPGIPGLPGAPGVAGSNGSAGSSGTVSVTQSTGPPVTVKVDKVQYQTGERTTYTVTGPASSPIYWSSWKGGVSTGEVDAFYGQSTDASGSWIGTSDPWPSDAVGSWVKQVKIQGSTAQASFSVTTAPACGYTWYATKVFLPDEHYTGCKGTLHMQLDGNLVIYSPSGIALWATGTVGTNNAQAVFQGDGNLVVYSPSGKALWASNTSAPGGRLVFQDDGNFVIYAAAGNPVWATSTFGDPPPPPPPPPTPTPVCDPILPCIP